MRPAPPHLLCAVLAWAAFAPSSLGQNGTPRQVDLKYGTRDLVPIISFDVTRAPYSVDPTGRRDCTKGFLKALKDAERLGGTVHAPAGLYRFDGELVIPSGVTLRGDWKRPTPADRSVGGTILMVYAGRGEAGGRPFVTANEGGLRDLSIHYPEQDPDAIKPYPLTVDLNGSAALQNVTLVNAYRGVLTGSFSTVRNLYGTSLETGITMLHAAAVPRCRTIRLSPRYWSESGLRGSPPLQQLQKVLLDRGSTGIQLNRQDAGIFMDVHIEYAHTAVKVMPPHGWTYWHDLQVSGCEVGIHFTGGSHQRVYITESSIATRRYGILMQMDKTGWDERGWLRLSKSGKPFGLKRDLANLRMFDCRFRGIGTQIHLDGSFMQSVNLQNCVFEEWGTGPDHYAIDAAAGELEVFDSTFKGRKRHLRFRSKARSLKVVGNTFAGIPDLGIQRKDGATIDHRTTSDPQPRSAAIQPTPDRLPARRGPEALYLATGRPFHVPSCGRKDASPSLQQALDQAGREGGGTVYLPQGLYRLTQGLTVPPGVELRGVNDFMPRGTQTRSMLLVDRPADRGKPGNAPMIRLQSSPALGGSGVAGLGIYYLHQDYTDIQAYPWTIRSMGPACWVQRVFLGNSYNAVDFATHDNDQHVISRVCGSALNIAFLVGQSRTIGWIDNCHIRPQDWSLMSAVEVRHRNGSVRQRGYVFDIPGEERNKPGSQDVFRGTAHSLIPNMRGGGAITVGSGANVQVTAFFTNGATRAFDFIDHKGTGGGHANILIGGSEAGWGAWIKALGPKGITLTNFSFNPMTRLPYVDAKDIPPGNLPKGLAIQVESSVSDSTPITLIQPKVYGRKEIDYGFIFRGGDILLKQGIIESGYRTATIKRDGGRLRHRNTGIGKVLGPGS
jgi:hypothetical protein